MNVMEIVQGQIAKMNVIVIARVKLVVPVVPVILPLVVLVVLVIGAILAIRLLAILVHIRLVQSGIAILAALAITANIKSKRK